MDKRSIQVILGAVIVIVSIILIGMEKSDEPVSLFEKTSVKKDRPKDEPTVLSFAPVKGLHEAYAGELCINGRVYAVVVGRHDTVSISPVLKVNRSVPETCGSGK